MAEATIRIKLGRLEVDYQGDAAFLKADLIKTVKELLDLQKTASASEEEDDAPDQKPAAKRRSGKHDHSTSTIAAVMGAKSGPDLLKAAAGHLHFVKHMNKYSRAELLAEMRNAPSYYKGTYASNLSQYLRNLTKSQELRDLGGETYALSTGTINAIENKLANAK